MAFLNKAKDLIYFPFHYRAHGVDLIIKSAFVYDLGGLCHIRADRNAFAYGNNAQFGYHFRYLLRFPFSTTLETIRPISKRATIGTAKSSMFITSWVGVIIAAKTRMTNSA